VVAKERILLSRQISWSNGDNEIFSSKYVIPFENQTLDNRHCEDQTNACLSRRCIARRFSPYEGNLPFRELIL